MKKIKTIFILGIFAILNACAGDAGTGDVFGNLFPGQWTSPTAMGGDKFLVEGYATRDAISGATQFCKSKGQIYEVVDLTPSQNDSRATLIFKCS